MHTGGLVLVARTPSSFIESFSETCAPRLLGNAVKLAASSYQLRDFGLHFTGRTALHPLHDFWMFFHRRSPTSPPEQCAATLPCWWSTRASEGLASVRTADTQAEAPPSTAVDLSSVCAHCAVDADAELVWAPGALVEGPASPAMHPSAVSILRPQDAACRCRHPAGAARAATNEGCRCRGDCSGGRDHQPRGTRHVRIAGLRARQAAGKVPTPYASSFWVLSSLGTPPAQTTGSQHKGSNARGQYKAVIATIKTHLNRSVSDL